MKHSSHDDPFNTLFDRAQLRNLKRFRPPLGASDATVFSAAVADMEFRAAPPIAEALEKRLGQALFGYESQPESLPDAIRAWFVSRHQWQIASEHVLRAPNVMNSLALTVLHFAEPGQGVIVQPPVFPGFFDAILEADRQLVPNPLVLKEGRYEMDFDHLERVAADPNNRLLMLCNPHNPVGRVWTRDELLQLGEICRRHHVMVVSDEIFSDVTFAGHRYTPFASLTMADQENCITCLSPEKSFNLSSCSAAFIVVANPELRGKLRTVQEQLTLNKNNAFSNVAMEAAYREAGPWLDTAIAYLSDNLELMRDELTMLDTVHLIEPESTFFGWVDFRPLGLDKRQLNLFLRNKARWIVMPGHVFGPEGEGFARVNFACPRLRLWEGLQRLKEAVAAL